MECEHRDKVDCRSRDSPDSDSGDDRVSSITNRIEVYTRGGPTVKRTGSRLRISLSSTAARKSRSSFTVITLPTPTKRWSAVWSELVLLFR
jgi:hypothetical protein